MESNGILIALLVAYFVFIILGRKFLRIDKVLLTAWTNLVLVVLLLVYTVIRGMLQDSPLLMVAFGVLVISSVIRIVKYKKNETAS